jgi:formate/nitrite transporter FocA (FNT family)
MLAVIGNVLAGGFVLGLFTATLRLTKPRKRS